MDAREDVGWVVCGRGTARRGEKEWKEGEGSAWSCGVSEVK